MERILDVKATFTGCNIKAGKATMSFELDPECRHLLGSLATMTGAQVYLSIKDPQQVIFVDQNTGEVLNEQAEGQTTVDEVLELPAAVVEDVKSNDELPEDISIDDDPAWWENGDAA